MDKVKLIDLHTHSTASDGSLSPGELVRHAREKGLAAIALTDHDTIDGVGQALEEGKRSGVEVIPGVEISVDFEPEMHMLGYFFDSSYMNIENILQVMRKNREERNPKMIRKLNEMGFDISMDEVEEKAGGRIIARPHIAQVMVDKGYVESVSEAFDKYLSEGRPAYYRRKMLSPEEGIREIVKAGGLPVLAHPVHLNMDYKSLDKLLEYLAEKGLKGIEAIYVDNSEEETQMLLKLADKHGLLVTGGSDYHGSFKPHIEIGIGLGNLHIPYELLEKMKTCLMTLDTTG